MDVNLHLTEYDSSGELGVGGTATPVDNRVSTRRTSGRGWASIANGRVRPMGRWTLSLPNTSEVRSLFDSDDENGIDDILLVITYSGQQPEWPQ
jgi:hypothetical protein